LSSESRAKSSLEIFENESLYNNLALSKNSSENKKEEKIENSTDNETSDKNETIVAVKSVKEHAKNLNRLNTQMELSTPQKPKNFGMLINKDEVKEMPVIAKHIDLETFDLADPKPTEKEWILVCSRCEYMEIAKWMSKHPDLAQKKDPFTVGFNKFDTIIY